MSWESLVDDTWVCPQCGYEIRKVFRMDDWNRREYLEFEDGIKIIESFGGDCSKPTCKKCGIDTEIKERKWCC